MKHCKIIPCLVCLFLAPGIFPLDFGVMLGEQFGAGIAGETELSSKTTVSSWVSQPLGEQADLHLSAGLTVEAPLSTDRPGFIPELFRLEVSWRPLPLLSFKAGRTAYEDPALLAARGLFDGLSVQADLGPVLLHGGLYYTGLLYRRRANISLSPGDSRDYLAALDYDDFTGTYFAPRRVLAALQGEFAGLVTPRGTLHAGLLGQFDCSGADSPLNSQYLLLRYELALPGGLDLALSGGAELKHRDSGPEGAFAGALKMGWMPPAALTNRLALEARWASAEGAGAGAWFPLTREAQGRVLRPGLSGIMPVRLSWEARFLETLSAELGAAYFIKTGAGPFTDPDLADDSPFLGGECCLSLLWVPFSDLSLTLDGGVFLPRTGNAFRDDAPPRWQLGLGLVFSL